MAYKILARHKDWIANTIISESVNSKDDRIRRFTATICGWRNWKIFEGRIDQDNVLQFVRNEVLRIKMEIERNNDSIFSEPNKYCTVFTWEDKSF